MKNPPKKAIAPAKGQKEASLTGSQGLGPGSLAPRLALAALGGLAQALTLPKAGLWPLAFFCLIPLYLGVRGQSPKRAFLIGWTYGLALGLASFSWLAQVMAGYGGLGAGGYAVLILLATYLAVYQGLWAILMAPFRPDGPKAWLHPILGGAFWVGLDGLKNFVFTGFNWSPLAVGLALAPSLMGAADLIGLYGLALPVAAINGWLALAIPKNPKTGPLAALAAGVFLALFLYGHKSDQAYTEIDLKGEPKAIAVLQASVEQEIKWDSAFRDQVLNRYALLFELAQKSQPWLTVWPETAAPFSYGQDAFETAWLDSLLAKATHESLVGVTSLRLEDDEWRLYNRAWLMGPDGPGPHYDKRHLVPFGEYVPLADKLPFLRWAFLQGVLGAAGRLSPGQPTSPIVHDGTTLGIMICFESTFPYLARDRALEGADLLVVTTNDAWFGDSWAPEQHLYQAAWRAVEERRPLVRAANNGISAWISPAGRILERSPQNEINYYTYLVRLPAPASQELTVYARLGYWLTPILAFLTVLTLLARLFRSPATRAQGLKIYRFLVGSTKISKQ
ncbi:MAG: apolipoprotein N-acyltransferase [Deltaproteobacteria bacterium]|jgi:apolipoprotein N-acyltransferase|nr:apolipoprotein N-acyltransferase [Deltaproteobacteria bacterium]